MKECRDCKEVRKGIVEFCDACDPCNECVSNVKICAFVVPTLAEGRYYKNSFIFVEEDDSTYFITEDRSEIPFGSRPKFLTNFEPEEHEFKNTVVFDVDNHVGYVYDEHGHYAALSLTDTPILSLEAGEGIVIDNVGGRFTISVEPDKYADYEQFKIVEQKVSEHDSKISGLETKTETLQTDVAAAKTAADEATSEASEAKSAADNALGQTKTLNEKVETKQDKLTAGDNITITDGEENGPTISAQVPTVNNATAPDEGEDGDGEGENGLMTVEDRKQLKQGIDRLGSIEITDNGANIRYKRNKSNNDGSGYTEEDEGNTSLTIPIAGPKENGAEGDENQPGLMSKHDVDALKGGLLTITGLTRTQQNAKLTGKLKVRNGTGAYTETDWAGITIPCAGNNTSNYAGLMSGADAVMLNTQGLQTITGLYRDASQAYFTGSFSRRNIEESGQWYSNVNYKFPVIPVAGSPDNADQGFLAGLMSAADAKAFWQYPMKWISGTERDGNNLKLKITKVGRLADGSGWTGVSGGGTTDTPVTLPPAESSMAGMMTGADATLLDNTHGVVKIDGSSRDATTFKFTGKTYYRDLSEGAVTVKETDYTSPTIPVADTSLAGVMSAQQVKDLENLKAAKTTWTKLKGNGDPAAPPENADANTFYYTVEAAAEEPAA